MWGLMRDLRRHGFDLAHARTLEMFGGTGALYTTDYVPHVGSLEVWEIDQNLAPELRRNLSRATIKIVDSFEELRLTKDKFDLVFIDPPYRMFDGHCEHFDLFPEVFRILNNFCVLVLCNVRLDVVMRELYSDEHLKRRELFYRVSDATRVSVDQMLEVYKDLAKRSGFDLKWWEVRNRILLYSFRKHYQDRVCYLALALQRNAGPMDTTAR